MCNLLMLLKKKGSSPKSRIVRMLNRHKKILRQSSQSEVVRVWVGVIKKLFLSTALSKKL